MASPEFESDEPLTPAGRLFLRPEINQVIHCIIGFQNPIDINNIKSQITNSTLTHHPRFSSLLVRDRSGAEFWRRTAIEVDRHVIVITGLDRTVDEYLADLAVSPAMAADKPLWEIHLVMEHKCAILRIHHALGDGISLMSLFLTCCRKVDEPEEIPVMGSNLKAVKKSEGRRGLVERIWKVLVAVLMAVWFSLVFVMEFIVRALWVCDRKTAISGGDGVELWPRKVATAEFLVEDMKVVKQAVPNATINDVLFSVIAAGLSRYLEHRQPNGLKEGLQLTGVALVNLRQRSGLQDLSDLMKGNSKSRWGNQLGILLLPVNYHSKTSDPLQYVKRSKAMIDRKKRSFEAHFSYGIGKFVMSYLGPKVACILNYRIMCNTSFTISNVMGPREEIAIGGNPISYLRATSTSLPHALTMHMVSYGGRADMQILVAKDIIPDPQFLAECFENALVEMKKAATTLITK